MTIIKIQEPEDLQLHNGITLYTFSSPECVPCKYINPIMDKIATDNDNIHVYRINSLEHTELAKQWNVKSVPTVFIFYNKELKHTLKSVFGIKHHLELLNA